MSQKRGQGHAEKGMHFFAANSPHFLRSIKEIAIFWIISGQISNWAEILDIDGYQLHLRIRDNPNGEAENCQTFAFLLCPFFFQRSHETRVTLEWNIELMIIFFTACRLFEREYVVIAW